MRQRDIFLMTFLAVSAASVGLSTGCGDLKDDGNAGNGGGDTNTSTGTDTGTGGTGTDTGTGGTGTGGTGTGGSTTAGWQSFTHPCVGNRTDALWLDDKNTAYVGCGTTTTGYGLYVTTDGGANWAAPTTNPANFWSSRRVSDVSRSADNLLYVGEYLTDSNMVVSADTSGATWQLSEVLKKRDSGGTYDWSMNIGTWRRAADGRAYAESDTGSQMLYRKNDNGAAVAEDDQTNWVDAYYWIGPSQTTQVQDMAIYNGQFYGCGAISSEPPIAILPKAAGSPGPTWQLVPVELATGLGAYDGFMRCIDIDDDGTIVVGGRNEDADVGMLYVAQADPRPETADDWTAFDVSTIETTHSNWINGVCIADNGSRIVAVGELPSQGESIVIVSDDNGATFTEYTPTDAPSALHECWVFDDGTFVVTGADGYYGVYHP